MTGGRIVVSFLFFIASVECIPFMYHPVEPTDPENENLLQQALIDAGIDATGLRILTMQMKNDLARTSYKATFTLPGSGVCFLKWRINIFGWKGQYLPSCDKLLVPLMSNGSLHQNENPSNATNLTREESVENSNLSEQTHSPTSDTHPPPSSEASTLPSKTEPGTKKTMCRYCPPGKPNQCYNFPCAKPNGVGKEEKATTGNSSPGISPQKPTQEGDEAAWDPND